MTIITDNFYVLNNQLDILIRDIGSLRNIVIGLKQSDKISDSTIHYLKNIKLDNIVAEKVITDFKNDPSRDPENLYEHIEMGIGAGLEAIKKWIELLWKAFIKLKNNIIEIFTKRKVTLKKDIDDLKGLSPEKINTLDEKIGPRKERIMRYDVFMNRIEIFKDINTFKLPVLSALLMPVRTTGQNTIDQINTIVGALSTGKGGRISSKVTKYGVVSYDSSPWAEVPLSKLHWNVNNIITALETYYTGMVHKIEVDIVTKKLCDVAMVSIDEMPDDTDLQKKAKEIALKNLKGWNALFASYGRFIEQTRLELIRTVETLRKVSK
ncbi:MAG: hypothetical protein GY804_08635 [Alphaproteobacteria bacterium]|nr:hypothetical protein [Alphaproteobacteria bacterium]